MGCENLAWLITWRPFLVLLRGLGGRSDLGLLCLLSAQLEWAAPDRDRGEKPVGLLSVCPAPTLITRQKLLSITHSHG